MQLQRFWTPERDAALRDAVARASSDVEAHRLLSPMLDADVEITVDAVGRRRQRLGIPGTVYSKTRVKPNYSSSPPPRLPVRELPDLDYEQDEETTPATPPRPTDPAPAIDEASLAKLVETTRRKPTTLEALCDSLDMSPLRVRGLVEVARERGYRVEIDGHHVGRRPQDDASPEHHDIQVPKAGERHVIAAVGDIHYGSKHHLASYFQDYCQYAYERGARKFLHVGDLLDGVYRHSVWDQSHRGYEEQVGVAIEQLPRWPDAEWFFIQGNHDETLGEANGLDVGRAIEQSFVAAGRTDMKYLGPRAAYVRLVAPGERRGLFVELWHPRDKSNAYAKSYRMQKHIEKYAPGQKPDLLLVGHWHQQMYFTTRGVHALSVGCWQGGQSAFGKSLGGAPDIGSWIIEYALTPEGTVRHIRPEWVGYFEKESVRDVALG